MDCKRLVLGGSVRFPQYLGWSWTGCGPRLPVLGAKNRTEPDLRTLGVKERSENLAAKRFMARRHHSHFAGAAEHLIKCSHRTAQHCVTCPVGARNPAQRGGNVTVEDPVSHLLAIRKMNCIVEPYRLCRGQFSSFWAWTTHQHSNSSSTADTFPR